MYLLNELKKEKLAKLTRQYYSMELRMVGVLDLANEHAHALLVPAVGERILASANDRTWLRKVDCSTSRHESILD
jgi:hypothetical protein